VKTNTSGHAIGEVPSQKQEGKYKLIAFSLRNGNNIY